MKLELKYAGSSSITSGLRDARASFAANQLREPAFFRGTVGRPLVLREGLAALHQVVVSDLRYRPKDRAAFKTWLEEQDRRFLATLGVKSDDVLARLRAGAARLDELDKARDKRLEPFTKARQRYLEYVYDHEAELAFILDPVVSVHPDELSFEAFSRDESSYARLAVRYDLFEKVEAFAPGTTNIDFSPRLARELDRLRSYRRTDFEVGAGGVAVTTGDATHREKKIDLPDSWVNGFLQVHSAMTLGLTRVTLTPIDLTNIVRFLARRRARTSPRALRWELEPGRRARVVFEPWEHALELSPASVFTGDKPLSVRTWGRDRLRVLARLLPVCERVHVYLIGLGLPSIYVLDLGDLSFTLALSGWTDSDWTGDTKLDLLARRLSVSAPELMRVHEALRTTRKATDAAVAQATGLGLDAARSALSYLCQIGRAMVDLDAGLYRYRELFDTPFGISEAVQAAAPLPSVLTPEEKAAEAIFAGGDVRITARRPVTTGYKLTGTAKGEDGKRVRPLLSVDKEGKVLDGSCTCAHHRSHQLTRGPCQHILALRLAHMARLRAEQKGGA